MQRSDTSPTILLSSDSRRNISLCNRNYSREGLYHPDRIMEEFDLLYMVSGSWDIYEENTCFSVGPGQALLLFPGRHHYSLKRCSPDMRNVFLHFSALPGDTHCSSIEDQSTDASCGRLRVNQLTDCSSDPHILRQIERIIDLYWNSGVPNRALWRSVLLDDILLSLASLREKQKSGHDELAEHLIKLFSKSPERFYSPAELAKDANVSLKTLSSRFKAATGESIHRYQMRLKLAMAYDLIPVSENRSMRDLAQSFGFYDEFQFSRLFKREYGMPPSARRKSR